VIAVVTLGLGVTGRLTLYISPESVWFACAAAVVTIAGAVWSFALPLGDEGDHGHDHGHESHAAPSPRRSLAVAGTVTGAAASLVVGRAGDVTGW
jgi:hypothetical protein